MLKLSELKPYKGSTKRRKVVGRGVGSGHGTYSGRGAKGQKSRAGASIPAGFIGGAMPLQRQIPKRRGFTSRAAKAEVISFVQLEAKFNNNETVNPKTLFNKNLISSAQSKIKILSEGEIKKSLTFEKVEISKAALVKIEKAGGKVVAAATKNKE